MLGTQAGVQNWRAKMNSEEINALGQIIDTTFGRSSSSGGTQSLKCNMTGDALTIKFMTIVHFAQERGLQVQTTKYKDEAMQKINACLRDVKAQFKEKTGRTLKTVDKGGDDNVELISSTANSPRKVAYYRVHRIFSIA